MIDTKNKSPRTYFSNNSSNRQHKSACSKCSLVVHDSHFNINLAHFTQNIHLDYHSRNGLINRSAEEHDSIVAARVNLKVMLAPVKATNHR